jgi:hypothetical protein
MAQRHRELETTSASGDPARAQSADDVSQPLIAVKEMRVVENVDELFEGDLVVNVPPLEAEYNRKSVGDQDGDNRGDHCSA